MTSLQTLGLLFALALLIGLIGFVRTVWFISLGYTAAVVAFSIVAAVLFATDISPLVAEQLLALSITGKFGIWIAVSLLYVCMFSPVVFLADSMPSLTTAQFAVSVTAVVVMWLGVAIEAIADRQKSHAKAAGPSRTSHDSPPAHQ